MNLISTLYEVKAIVQPFLADRVVAALHEIPELPGVTVSEVRGFGRSRGLPEAHQRRAEDEFAYVNKTKLEVVVSAFVLPAVITAIQKNGHTGNPGDGKIFIIPVSDVIRIRTGERGEAGI